MGDFRNNTSRSSCESVFINCINKAPEPSKVLPVEIHYEPREMGDFRLIGFRRQWS